ncbi:RNA polymerase sigma factor [Actinomadura sp. 6N118]|uniref:RNA polymerase sigma factor n=1 Tax=Actinomadura sp. 6N118 TaxID=3375151 RepID=UPI0037AEFCFF
MREEFLELHEADHHRVVAFVRSNGASLDQAQEATHEAFVEAWQAVQTPGAWERIEHPAAWIRTVALRRYRRPPGARGQVPMVSTPPELLPEHHPGTTPPPDPMELAIGRTDVLAALRTLDDDCRAVIAFAMDGFSAVDTAAALGMDYQKVCNLRRKARKQLAALLAPACQQARQQEGGTTR